MTETPKSKAEALRKMRGMLDLFEKDDTLSAVLVTAIPHPNGCATNHMGWSDAAIATLLAVEIVRGIPAGALVPASLSPALVKLLEALELVNRLQGERPRAGDH